MAKQTKKADVAPAQSGPSEEESQSAAMQAYDWSKSSVTGFEQVKNDDLGIPFLAIIQSGSPQIKRGHAKYEEKKILGAQEGDIYNTISNALVYKHGEEPLEFVPCHYERLFIEWGARDKGGGFVKAHKTDAILLETSKNERNQDVLRNGNLIANTAYFFGHYRTEDGWKPAVIGMTSTQLKKARGWLNKMQAIKFVDKAGNKFTPPMFSHTYAISTQPENNNDGSWMGWKIEVLRPIEDVNLISECVETAKRSQSTQRAALIPPSDDEADHKPPYA